MTNKYHQIVYSDMDLVPVLKKANDDELDALKQLLQKKFRCKLKKEGNNDIPAIVNAFQEMARNYFLLFFLGKGKPYSLIVHKVAKKVGAKPQKQQSVPEMELNIIIKILEKAEKKLQPEQREELRKEMESVAGRKLTGKTLGIILKQGGLHTVRVLIAHLVAKEVLKKAGIQLTTRVVASATAGRFLALLGGPIGWAVSILWLLWDLSGPAYTVMIPGVVLVGAMRIRQQAEESAEEMGE